LTEYAISPTSLRPAQVALGQKLFFEPRLSGDGTVACATCHDPARAFTDGRPLSIGIHGRVGQRNAPTVLNALYSKTQFWDGRVTTLEQQAALPITNPFEMGAASMDAAVAAIADKAKAKLPECNSRVDKAVALVLNGDVELLPDGTARSLITIAAAAWSTSISAFISFG